MKSPAEFVIAAMTRLVSPSEIWIFTITEAAGWPLINVALPVNMTGLFVGITVVSVETVAV